MKRTVSEHLKEQLREQMIKANKAEKQKLAKSHGFKTKKGSADVQAFKKEIGLDRFNNVVTSKTKKTKKNAQKFEVNEHKKFIRTKETIESISDKKMDLDFNKEDWKTSKFYNLMGLIVFIICSGFLSNYIVENNSLFFADAMPDASRAMQFYTLWAVEVAIGGMLYMIQMQNLDRRIGFVLMALVAYWNVTIYNNSNTNSANMSFSKVQDQNKLQTQENNRKKKLLAGEGRVKVQQDFLKDALAVGNKSEIKRLKKFVQTLKNSDVTPYLEEIFVPTIGSIKTVNGNKEASKSYLDLAIILFNFAVNFLGSICLKNIIEFNQKLKGATRDLKRLCKIESNLSLA